MNCDKTAQVRSHEALGVLREAMRRFHGKAQDCAANIRQKATQSLSEIQQNVQAQQHYVDSLELDTSGSSDDAEEGDTAELDAARDRLAELQGAQSEVECIAAEIESELRQFETELNELIPGATDFLQGKLDILNEKAGIRLDAVETPGTSNKMLQPISDRSLAAAQDSSVQAITDSPENVPLPNGYRWIPLSQIDLAHELSGVASPNDFQKVDYVTMRRGLETIRNEVLPALNANSGKSLWDLNVMFRDRDKASGKSYEYGVQRAFESFFSQEDAIYLTRGREEEHFTIINGRHRIKAALDAGWTAIPARTKDLRQ
jgi:hypothetical protein